MLNRSRSFRRLRLLTERAPSSKGRVRKPDAPDPVVLRGPVGQAPSPPGMTVETPGVGLDQAVADGPGPDRRHPLPQPSPSSLAANRTRRPGSSAFIQLQAGPLDRL